MTNFERAFNKVLESEGTHYTDHPNDNGGPTKFGITIADYSRWCGKKVASSDVKNMTMEEAKKIYKKFYWDSMKLDEIVDYGVAYAIFDQGVNKGVGKGVQLAQLAAKVKADGVMGPVSIVAINAMKPMEFYVEYFFIAQLGYIDIVKRNSSQMVFLKGWINRTHKMLREMLGL